jgi:hypothetical protein
MASDGSAFKEVPAVAVGTVRLCGWPSLGAWVFEFVLSSVDSEALRQNDPHSTENIIYLQAVELTSENVIPRTVVVCTGNRRTA